MRRHRSILTGIMLMIAALAFSQRVDTIDYSYLSFNEVNDYYHSKGLNVASADNPDLYFEIFDWLSTPYQWAGKSKYGVDCSGLVAAVFNKLYSAGLGGSATDIYKKCDEVLPTELQEGDLVFFNINGHYLYHVGIYLADGMFAHAAVHGGVIVSSMEEVYYRTWFYKAARVRMNLDTAPTDKPIVKTSPAPPADPKAKPPLRKKRRR